MNPGVPRNPWIIGGAGSRTAEAGPCASPTVGAGANSGSQSGWFTVELVDGAVVP